MEAKDTTGKFYTYYPNPRVFKSQILGKFVKKDFAIQPDFKMGIDNKTDHFMGIHPFGQVPCFVFENHNSGVFESNSILRYFARYYQSARNMYGDSPLSSSRIDGWLDTVLVLDYEARDWIYSHFGYDKTLSPEAILKSKTNLKKKLVLINHWLQKHEFLEGSISIADIAIFCALLNGYKELYDDNYISDLPALNNWFLKLYAMKEFRDVVGVIEAKNNSLFKK